LKKIRDYLKSWWAIFTNTRILWTINCIYFI